MRHLIDLLLFTTLITTVTALMTVDPRRSRLTGKARHD